MSTRVAYGVVLAVAACTTLLATPLFRQLALRTGVVQAPGERRVHLRATALLGGAAMLVGFLVAMFVAWHLDAFHEIFSGTTEPLGVVIAAVLMLAVGTIDDVREVSPPAKVAGIVLCASVLVFSGVSLLIFRIPFEGVISLDPSWSYLLSVLWVLGMTNAINLIDGLDGLAAGIVAIAAGSFFLYTVQLTQQGLLQEGNIAPLIAVIVLGMCVGFLPFNVHPAKIFMGDGGALMLGLLMAASTMTVGGRVDQQCVDTAVRQCSGQTYFFFAPLFIPLFILGVPIFDTFLAIVRRAKKRSGVASADKEHIHHRLMRLGHGQRRSVLILWAWTLILSIMVLYPTYNDTGTGTGLVPLGIAALGLALYTVLHPGARSSRAERKAEAEAESVSDTDTDTEAVGGTAVAVATDERATTATPGTPGTSGTSGTPDAAAVASPAPTGGGAHRSRARRGIGHRREPVISLLTPDELDQSIRRQTDVPAVPDVVPGVVPDDGSAPKPGPV